ncbi:MAG: hypothetical protein P4L77_11090 [Sulfuriferula sp.]|nr:hypothetical protein [Sulfuriferula sp.]
MDLDLLTQLKDHEQSGRKAYFELLEHAERLERGYGQYFKPYTGKQMYFEYGTRPALDFDKQRYHSFVTADPLNHGQAGMVVKIKGPKDLEGGRHDILNQDDLVVVRGKDISKLRSVPTYPKRMMDFIVEYAADYALSRIPVAASTGRGFNAILRTYLNDEFQIRLNELDKISKSSEVDDFCNEVYHFLEHLMSDVREFMGPNKWMVHLVSLVGVDLVIDTFVDFRIYKYTLDLREQARAKEDE